MSSPRVCFIVGCARSGTSILGELIGAHPEVTYVWEAHWVWEQVGHGPNGSHRYTAGYATPRVKNAIRDLFSRLQRNGRVVVEKCPRNVLRVPFLKALFPEAKIIHIVRDGRDVACSLMPGIGGEKWRHLKPVNWRNLMSDYTGITRCALAWKGIVETALADLAGVLHLQIRYEDLVAAPHLAAQTIFEYLGLALHPAVLGFCHNIRDRTASSYHARGQVKWYRDNHSKRVGRWRENLGREEQRLMTSLLAPTLRWLGYTVQPAAFADGTGPLPIGELNLDVKPTRAPSPG